MTGTYHFVTHWRVKALADEVYDIISQPTEYPRWWPSVYLDVQERFLDWHSRGGLGKSSSPAYERPAALHPPLGILHNRSDSSASHRLIEAAGDLNGRGVWSFAQGTAISPDVTFEWNIAEVEQADTPAI